MNKVTFKKTKDTDKANLWVAYQDGQLVDICISEICDFDLTNLRYRIYKRSEKLDAGFMSATLSHMKSNDTLYLVSIMGTEEYKRVNRGE